jgi:glutamate/aspartate transport system substrate-binding protein
MIRATLAVAAVLTPCAAWAQASTIDKIETSGAITIGYRETAIPFAFIDQEQKVTGYSIEICEQIVDSLKKRLKLPSIQIRYLPVSPQTRIPLLANGTIDLECGTTTITLSRRRQVSFSYPTFLTGTRFAVKRSSQIKELSDLAGKTIGFAQGTTDERIVREMAAKDGIQNIRQVNFKEVAEGMLALETGRVDAFVADDILLFSLISKSRRKDELEIVGPPLDLSPYGIMMRRNDDDFRLAVDAALSEIFRSNKIKELYAKWFSPLGVPLAPQLQTAFDLGALQE